MSTHLEALRAYLDDAPRLGQVPFGQVADVERLLRDCWDELEITSDDERMEGYKVLNRTECLAWEPPFLTFDIERHGATVSGSTRGEVHSWKVNVETGEATIEHKRRRQLDKSASRWNAAPLVEEITALVMEGKQDRRLAWKSSSTVRIRIRGLVPGDYQQTRASRLKRFRAELEKALAPHGWRQSARDCYEHSTQQGK